MSKHKAPTQITIASTADESEFHLFVQRHWKTATLVAAVVVVGILGRVYFQSQGEVTADESWARLRGAVDFGDGVFGRVTPLDAARLDALADELADEQAGPWARALEVSKRIEDEDFQGAIQALDELEARYPHHPVVTQEFQLEEDGPRETLPATLRRRIEALKAWKASHETLFENPPLAADAPRVRLETTAGPIVVGLYTEQAPKHCENFLKLCREGFYDNTKVHRVIRGFMIQGGDPNTRDGDPGTWGTGGPGYKLDPEISDLAHFPLVLAAAKMGNDTQSSGSQFYITTGAAHHLDGKHTVFGRVVEGESVVRTIEEGTVEGDRPTDPVTILRTDVLE